MEAIIHPGMHKTGSSSIQATLMALKPEGWVLPDTPQGNMSARFALFFENNPHEHHSFKAAGLSAETVQQERAVRFERFESKLKEGSENGLNALFSGEYVSLGSRSALENLAKIYQKYGYKPRVIAYVRRPLSFMQSAFQQRLKGNLTDLEKIFGLWPGYRERFEKLDNVFGRNNVQIVIFDRKTLDGGDVCVDFFHKIGLKITNEQVVRVNESMSLAACALLFAQRNLGEGFVQGFERAHSKNDAFISALSRLPGEPLKFKHSYVAPVFEKFRSDLDWMEERLGVSLSDLPDEDSPNAVGSEEDLLAIADKHRDVLEEILVAEIRKEGTNPRDRLVRNLELLRNLHY